MMFFLFFSFAFSKDIDLTLSTWSTPPLSLKNQNGYLDQLFIEAFKRINKRILILNKPTQRSITDANKGRSDGEFIRVAGLSKLYKNLIQVPEEIFQFEFVAFSKKENIVIRNWDSLTQYHTGIIIGWKILEKNIKQTNKRYSFREPKHMFKMLENDRVTLVVYSRYLGTELINELGYKDISVVLPPLAVKPMYLYLHKKHKDLVPLLVKSLKSMKGDGTFQRIRNQYLLKK